MPVHVLVTALDYTAIIDKLVKTLPNGFINLWLSCNHLLTLRLQVGGYEVSGVVTTFADSYTCITTFQLAKAKN